MTTTTGPDPDELPDPADPGEQPPLPGQPEPVGPRPIPEPDTDPQPGEPDPADDGT